MLQSVKLYPEGGLVSSEAPNGLMVQRNLVSHLASPVLLHLFGSKGSPGTGDSSQHIGVSWLALVNVRLSSLFKHSAHSPVGLV